MASVNSSSGVNSIYNSLGIKNTGMGGLVSGLDTDSLVEALTSGTRSKIAKQGQQRQLFLWQQTAYRSTATMLRNFQTKNFTRSGSPGAASYIGGNQFFNTYKGSSTSDKVSLISSSTTAVGSVTIDEIKQLATSQTITVNKKFTSDLTGGAVDLQEQSYYGKTLQITMDNGPTKTIRLDELDDVSGGDADEYRANFQTKLQELVDTAVGKRSATQKEIDDGLAVDGKVSIVNVNVDAVEDGDGSTIQLTADSNKLVVASDTAKDALGITKGQTNRVNLSTKLKDVDMFKDMPEDVFKFKVNGTLITLDKNKDSLSDMMTRISNSAAGVKVSYSNLTEQFTFTAVNPGAGENILMEDVEGNFLRTFVGAKGTSSLTSGEIDDLSMGYGSSVTAANTFRLNDMLQNQVGKNGVVSLTIDGVSKKLDIGVIPEMVVDDAGNQTWNGLSAEEYLQTALNEQIEKEFGADSGVSFEITKTPAGRYQSALNVTGDVAVSMGSSTVEGNERDLFGRMGYGTGPVSNDLGPAASTDLATLFGETGGTFEIMNKNGEMVEIAWGDQGDISNLRDLIDKVNNAAGYDLMSGKDGRIALAAGERTLKFEDTSGNAMQALFGKSEYSSAPDTSIATTDYGQNAEIVVDGRVIASSSNVFTVNDIAFEVSDKTEVGDKPIVITSKSDADGLIGKINTFVDEYNALITSLNTMINEEKKSGYAPLTDEQKSQMSEDQIKKWETEAQKGILRNDSTLRSIVSDLRTAMTKKIEGAGISLYDIGIEIESYYTGGSINYNNAGKITVNEDRLRKAIEQTPDAVRLAFTAEDGIANTLSDIIERATNTKSGPQRGSLVALAGSDVLTGDNTSVLGDKISNIDKYVSTLKTRLQQEYSRHWSKFTALETALQRMSSQSSWLTQNAG